MDHVVVDVEIQKTIEETPGGWDATDKLGVAVACVWEYSGARMRVYGPDDVEALQERLLAADRISGYNILNFDFPVIWGVAKPDWIDQSRLSNPQLKERASVKARLLPKTDDMLRRIWQALGLDPDNFQGRTHGGYSLDKVAWATLDAGKIGHGEDAPKWYQAGQVQRVVNYCADDMALERDLTDFVDRYGYVLVNDQGALRPRQIEIPRWRGGV